jgi:hypothetical protein
MEILILDSLLRPIDVVDTFESLVWAERFSEMGDFELRTISTPANQKRFVVDTILAMTESDRLMQVKTAIETIDEEKGAILKITGKEISSILDSRPALKAVGLGVAPTWYIPTMTPANVMRHIFERICVDGSVSVADIIPFIELGTNLYPADTIPEPSVLIDWDQKPASVYSALKELGDIFDLGHRLYKDPNLTKLYFNVYAGSDRTSGQSTLPPVIFSTDMDNLQNTTDFNDVSNYFNIVRVIYTYEDEDGNEFAQIVTVSEDETNPPEGFDRRVKVLVITSIPEEVTDIPAFLTRAGQDELLKSRPLGAFDGEINPNSEYVYRRNYYLGDLVEMRGNSGATSYMRVEEFIFVQDEQGQRSYPTLTIKKFINPGTWLSWKYDVEWTAMGSEEYWGNQ